jgi:cationic peptide transport system permease protein
MREQDIIKWGLVPHPDVAEFINMCWRHMMNCISGDFGHSFLTHEPVSIHLGERIANTSLLVGVSLFASLLIGSALVAREEDIEFGRSSKISKISSQITNSTPIYWVGMVVLFAGAYALPNHFGFGFPEFGTIAYETWIASLTTASGGIMIYIDVLFHLFLPMSILTLGGTSIIYSTLKTNLSENLTIERATSDFVKGISSEYNFYSSLRKSLQVIKEWFPLFMSTLVLVEVVFTWRGVGKYMFDSLLLLDYPAIRGCIITLSLFVILADLIFDIAFNLLITLEKNLNRLERFELRTENYERYFVEKCR